jgi:hypothetical protein
LPTLDRILTGLEISVSIHLVTVVHTLAIETPRSADAAVDCRRGIEGSQSPPETDRPTRTAEALSLS